MLSINLLDDLIDGIGDCRDAPCHATLSDDARVEDRAEFWGDGKKLSKEDFLARPSSARDVGAHGFLKLDVVAVRGFLSLVNLCGQLGRKPLKELLERGLAADVVLGANDLACERDERLDYRPRPQH